MDTIIAKRNKLAGEKICIELEKRGFSAYYSENSTDALQLALQLIPDGSLISWGGSKTIDQIGLLDSLRQGNYQLLDRDVAKTIEDRNMIMKQAMLCDVFLMSTNAITETGELINVDGNGNRVAAMLYGPDSVIVIVGMNKLVKTIADGVARVRNKVAPINAQRFKLETPCQLDGMCHNCNAPDCICNYIVCTRRCKPAGRIKVILVNEILGY